LRKCFFLITTSVPDSLQTGFKVTCDKPSTPPLCAPGTKHPTIPNYFYYYFYDKLTDECKGENSSCAVAPGSGRFDSRDGY
jgi:hypothetical protein